MPSFRDISVAAVDLSSDFHKPEMPLLPIDAKAAFVERASAEPQQNLPSFCSGCVIESKQDVAITQIKRSAVSHSQQPKW